MTSESERDSGERKYVWHIDEKGSATLLSWDELSPREQCGLNETFSRFYKLNAQWMECIATMGDVFVVLGNGTLDVIKSYMYNHFSYGSDGLTFYLGNEVVKHYSKKSVHSVDFIRNGEEMEWN